MATKTAKELALEQKQVELNYQRAEILKMKRDHILEKDAQTISKVEVLTAVLDTEKLDEREIKLVKAKLMNLVREL